MASAAAAALRLQGTRDMIPISGFTKNSGEKNNSEVMFWCLEVEHSRDKRRVSDHIEYSSYKAYHGHPTSYLS